MSFYDDASIVLIPSGYKTSKLYSQKPTDGSGDLTFTRTGSTATRVNESGLIERCRTNQGLYSEQFNNAYWTKYNSTIILNTTETLDPLNGNSSDILLSNNATLTTGTEGNVAYISGVNYTASIYVKYKNTQFIQMHFPSFVSTQYVNFNIQTGIISGGSYSSASITSIGNGWYRCSLSIVSNYSGTTAFGPLFLIDSATSLRDAAFTGDGIKSAYIFGAQFEIGDIATDYIPTTSAAVTVGPIANLPRLDYTGGGCPKLLMEPTRTNLITYSQQFNTSSWPLDGNGAGQSVTANYAISPDGYKNADRIQLNRIGGGYSRIRQDYVNANPGVGSIYLKTNDSTTKKIWLRIGGGINNKITITPDWQRFIVSYTSLTGMELYIDNSDAEIASIVDISAYGAQLELGSYATSYIPTFNASVTRNQDSASKTGISSLIGQTEGTIFIEGSIFDLISYKRIGVNDGGFTDSVFFDFRDDGTVYATIYVNGSQVLFKNVTPSNQLNINKYAIAYKQNDFAVYVNGSNVASQTSGSISFAQPLSVLQTSLGGNEPFFGKLNQIQVYKTRLSNSDLATLTTL